MTQPSDELVDAFQRIVDESYKVAAYRAHGEEGVAVLADLLARVRQLLVHVPYEMLTVGVKVVMSIDPSSPPHAEGGATYQDFAGLAGQTTDRLTVAVTGPTSNRVWMSEVVALTVTSPVITYTYVHGQREDVEIGGQCWPVNQSPWECGMATPTFRTLEKALDTYVAMNRVPVQCLNIAQTWRDDARLAFMPKPEASLRDSLLLALQYVLTDAQVRPELNQGKTKPVDIEINWWGQKRSAIIEVKWLGDSGPPGDEWSTSYGIGRAKKGMKQLADYLALRDGTTSDVPVIGHLFVFDARRKDLTPQQTVISREDGLYFQTDEPDYDQEHLDRADMGRPYRCFMEPVFT